VPSLYRTLRPYPDGASICSISRVRIATMLILLMKQVSKTLLKILSGAHPSQCWVKTNVSETNSVSIIRVDVRGDHNLPIFVSVSVIGHLSCLHPQAADRASKNNTSTKLTDMNMGEFWSLLISTLMVETELFSEMLFST
jgi:hypothetical protein